MLSALLAVASLVAPLRCDQACVLRPELSSSALPLMTLSTRRAALSAFLIAAPVALPRGAAARPEGVNKPELLPAYQTNVIDLQRFLTSGQVKAMDKKLTELEKATGIKFVGFGFAPDPVGRKR